MRSTGAVRPRIRARLLVLLWIWAAVVFMVVDLFRNVPEFDRVRPDWGLYRNMRIVAHEMVGEPIADVDASAAPPRRESARSRPFSDAGALRAALAAVSQATSATELEASERELGVDRDLEEAVGTGSLAVGHPARRRMPSRS